MSSHDCFSKSTHNLHRLLNALSVTGWGQRVWNLITVIVTCCQDHKAFSWQIVVLVHSVAVPAVVAAPLSLSGYVPVLVSFPALCAFFLSPISPSPTALCQDAAFEIQVALALSGASVFHPAHE